MATTINTSSQHPFVVAADRFSNLGVGENGHIEHGWSNNFIEKVVQFNFQLVRTDIKNHHTLATILRGLLTDYTQNIKKFQDDMKKPTFCSPEIAQAQYGQARENIKKITPYFIALYRLIGQTRDITVGRGEYSLAFMQIAVWYEFYPKAAMYALKKFVQFNDNSTDEQYDTSVHPYGSWKDIKYFCDYMVNLDKSKNYSHPLVVYALALMVNQIKNDEKNYREQSQAQIELPADAPNQIHISLAARWAPRATSKRFGWMFNIMAHKYFAHYLDTVPTDIHPQDKNNDTYGRASRKAKMDFRKVLSRLNRFLDTTQIKQCEGRWRHIDHKTVTSITARKQKKAFQYVDKWGHSRAVPITETTETGRRLEIQRNSDRVECAENFTFHIEAAMAGDKTHKIKGKRTGVGELVKDALTVLRMHPGMSSTTEQLKSIEEERNHINLQWEDNGTQNENLGPMIACVDTSGSMEVDNGTPLHNAIGLGIRIAEKSILGKRIATFSATPSWVNLETAKDFVGCVDKVRRCNWGYNTDFHALLDMILNACKESRLEPRNVENMVLVVLSDMQIDSSEVKGNNETMFDLMRRRYYDTGMELFGKPYKVPHIVFWNLRKTEGFPVLTNEQNTTMMSGFNPALLNNFMEKGLEALKDYTASTMFRDIVRNTRYDCLERCIRAEIKETFEESLFH